MRLLPCGDAAVLVELDDLDTVLRLAEALTAALLRSPDPDVPHAGMPGTTAAGDGAPAPPGVVDVVPAARTVLVRCRPGTDLGAMARWLRSTTLSDAVSQDGPEVRIPVRYDGEDLPDVARLTGLSVAEVARRHQAAGWRVAFTGFAPGFGYLVGGDHVLTVPRRRESRARVPAGAVGLAAGFSGVYPRSTPGGWQLIGRTETLVWDPERTPPALLSPGTRVRFEAVAG